MPVFTVRRRNEFQNVAPVVRKFFKANSIQEAKEFVNREYGIRYYPFHLEGEEVVLATGRQDVFAANVLVQ